MVHNHLYGTDLFSRNSYFLTLILHLFPAILNKKISEYKASEHCWKVRTDSTVLKMKAAYKHLQKAKTQATAPVPKQD